MILKKDGTRLNEGIDTTREICYNYV